MKKELLAVLTTTILGISSVQAATVDTGGGHVDFFGKVTEVSCSISVNGQGSDAAVYLAPISVMEFDEGTEHTLLKSTKFSVELSKCSPAAEGKKISVLWTGGNLLQNTTEASLGYLTNTSDIGAKNVHFALSTSDTIENKIIPGDQNQPLAKNETENSNAQDGIATFSYYVGYATATPTEVVSGDLHSYATYEVTYM